MACSDWSYQVKFSTLKGRESDITLKLVKTLIECVIKREGHWVNLPILLTFMDCAEVAPPPRLCWPEKGSLLCINVEGRYVLMNGTLISPRPRSASFPSHAPGGRMAEEDHLPQKGTRQPWKASAR
jgi:hypothetical protein